MTTAHRAPAVLPAGSRLTLLSHQAGLAVDRTLQEGHVAGDPADEIDVVARRATGISERASAG